MENQKVNKLRNEVSYYLTAKRKKIEGEKDYYVKAGPYKVRNLNDFGVPKYLKRRIDWQFKGRRQISRKAHDTLLKMIISLIDEGQGTYGISADKLSATMTEHGHKASDTTCQRYLEKFCLAGILERDSSTVKTDSVIPTLRRAATYKVICPRTKKWIDSLQHRKYIKKNRISPDSPQYHAAAKYFASLPESERTGLINQVTFTEETFTNRFGRVVATKEDFQRCVYKQLRLSEAPLMFVNKQQSESVLQGFVSVSRNGAVRMRSKKTSHLQVVVEFGDNDGCIIDQSSQDFIAGEFELSASDKRNIEIIRNHRLQELQNQKLVA